MANPWEKPGGWASDTTWVRRVYLDLAGRLPTPDEAKRFVRSPGVRKRERLVDRLLAGEDFADYWSMRLCDLLRVKSEFPINLWPNAVYVYHRRIREAVAKDEPWDRFAAALVTATGSDFRDAEANYIRASADRSPEGLARTAVKTFFDEDLAEWPEADRREAVAAFANVRIKPTREWKEELVYSDGPDRRSAFVALMTGPKRARFAAAFAGYVRTWIFGRRGADAELGARFAADGFSLKALCRTIALSEEYARGSVTGGFPLRRLDAEVLEDALVSLLGLTRDYQSIAPEPFTYLPKDRKSVLIEDGSISSSFLTLFGRPPRDSGDLAERKNDVTAKQRLYLYNSGRLYRHLMRMKGDVDSFYWRFLSRPPTDEERRIVAGRRLAPKDLGWCLMNTREFLYRT